MTTTDYQAWTCPTCGRTTTAGLLTSAQWHTHRIKVQRVHADRHAGTGRQT